MNFKTIAKLLGALLVLESLAMFLCGGYASLLSDAEQGNSMSALMVGGGVTMVAGCILFFSGLGRSLEKVSRREGMAVVGLGWILAGVLGGIPYTLCEASIGLNGEPGQKLDFISGVFESVSGFTTTGSTTMTNIESWPKPLLLWRAVTQWLGGLGILVLFVAVFSYLGMGSKSLFRNESSFQTGEAATARIRDTANTLLGLYLLITFICALGLKVLGMDVYDAVTHAFTTVSTGGFSPKNASIAHYEDWQTGPLIELWLTIFMIICSISFLVWVVLISKKWKRLKEEEEGKFFIGWCIGGAFILAIGVMVGQDMPFFSALRQTWFTVVSLGSSTGYATADYELWPGVCHVMLGIVMLIGGCAGSTSGGLKISRLILMVRTARYEVVRAFRPHKVTRVQVNGNSLNPDARAHTMIFLVLYGVIAVTSTLIVALLEVSQNMDMDSAIGVVIATLFNVGPGFSQVGPTDNFDHLLPGTKTFLCLLMIIGRLELYAVLVLFLPSFWRKY